MNTRARLSFLCPQGPGPGLARAVTAPVHGSDVRASVSSLVPALASVTTVQGSDLLAPCPNKGILLGSATSFQLQKRSGVGSGDAHPARWLLAPRSRLRGRAWSGAAGLTCWRPLKVCEGVALSTASSLPFRFALLGLAKRPNVSEQHGRQAVKPGAAGRDRVSFQPLHGWAVPPSPVHWAHSQP